MLRQGHGLAVQFLAVQLPIGIDQRHPLRGALRGLAQRIGERAPDPPAVRVGACGAIGIPANPAPIDEPALWNFRPSHRPALLVCHTGGSGFTAESTHRHRVTEPGRRMGVERDLGHLLVGCHIGASDLQGRRSRFDLEAVGQRR